MRGGARKGIGGDDSGSTTAMSSADAPPLGWPRGCDPRGLAPRGLGWGGGGAMSYVSDSPTDSRGLRLPVVVLEDEDEPAVPCALGVQVALAAPLSRRRLPP